MLERIIYTNHLNESYGEESGIYFNKSDIRDYEWEYISNNNLVTHFYKGLSSRNIHVVIRCRNPDEGIRKANQMFEIMEKDVLYKKSGKLFIGDYYLNCYCIGIAHEEYLTKRGFIKATLKIIAENPTWIKEKNFSFRAGNGESVGETPESDFLDYGFDYPIDYGAFAKQKLKNTYFDAVNFKMRIFGEGTNPEVKIGNNLYRVNCTILQGEYLEIDSLQKKINLIKLNGEAVNMFSMRDRENYIFSRIEPGTLDVSWKNLMKLQIILYEERSMPKWI